MAALTGKRNTSLHRRNKKAAPADGHKKSRSFEGVRRQLMDFYHVGGVAA